MRKIILAAVGLLVLGGGGAGAYFVLLKKPAEAALPPAEQAAADAHKAEQDKAKAEGGHGEDKGPTYVKLDPLVVPVMDSEGISQVISMVIAFEVTDEEAGKKLETLKPRIKDAMIQNMYGMLNHQSALENGVLKVGYVKERLNSVAQKVAGEGVVKDVLLQMVQQNPI